MRIIPLVMLSNFRERKIHITHHCKHNTTTRVLCHARVEYFLSKISCMILKKWVFFSFGLADDQKSFNASCNYIFGFFDV